MKIRVVEMERKMEVARVIRKGGRGNRENEM